MTAYEMRISDWSADVCSSDLELGGRNTETVRRLAQGDHLVAVTVLRRGRRRTSVVCHIGAHTTEPAAAAQDGTFGGLRWSLGERSADRKSKRLNSSH